MATSKDLLDELFSAQECEEILEFQIRGQYRDKLEPEPTNFEFGSSKTKCSENVAQWAKRRNTDKYNYSSGYASISKVDKTKNAYIKRDSDDFVQVAVPSLAGFVAVTSDSDYLAEKLTKSAQQLVTKFKQGAAKKERLVKNTIPFDATYFVGKDGKRHISQYVLIVTIENWVENNKENKTAKPSLADVDLEIRLRSTLNAEYLADKSGLEKDEGFATDGFCYKAKLGHFTGMLKSDAFKRVHREAAEFWIEQSKKENGLLSTAEETMNNVTKPPAKHRLKAKRKQPQLTQQISEGSAVDDSENPGKENDLEEGEISEKIPRKTNNISE